MVWARSVDPWSLIRVRTGMKTATFAALVAVATGLFASGCATMPQEGGVAVNLVSIRPLQSSLFETSAELTLRFTNESSRPLALAGSTHRLYVNGTYIGRAVTNEPLTLPQLGTMTQTLTAHVENLALMRKAQELGNVSSVDYKIDSRLHATDAHGGGTLAATSTGQLDLGGLLPVQAAPPRAQ
jgi:LEA14-like dessication related protein